MDTPPIPASVLAVFKECIEFFDEKPALALAELVQRLQVQNSRLYNYMDRYRFNNGIHLVLAANIDGAIVDTVDVLARAGYLFTYARGRKVDDFKPRRDRIESNLGFILGFDDVDEIKAFADKWERMNSFRDAVEANEKSAASQ